MSKTHPPYAPEYRRQRVELVRAGQTAAKVEPGGDCGGSPEPRIHALRPALIRCATGYGPVLVS